MTVVSHTIDGEHEKKEAENENASFCGFIGTSHRQSKKSGTASTLIWFSYLNLVFVLQADQ